MPSQILVSDPQFIKPVKNLLDSTSRLDKAHKIARRDGVSVVYSTGSPHQMSSLLAPFSDHITVEEWTPSEASGGNSLPDIVSRYFGRIASSEKSQEVDLDALLALVPKKWSVYHPMVLFGAGSFDSPEWNSAFAQWLDQASFFANLRLAFPATITHFAVNRPIVEQDVMRRPFHLVPLYGNFGPEPTDALYASPTPDDLQDAFWCHVVQNGIYQTWAPRYTMFSRGNIKEKKRILDSYKDLRGHTVVDLYAGIGYFTLSYLANGATLFCWELNPWSIEGLAQGLGENGYKYKIFTPQDSFSPHEYASHRADGVRAFIFHESNEEATNRLQDLGPLGISHINLGLLPTSKDSWDIAQLLARASANEVTVHVHENVGVAAIDDLQHEVAAHFGGEVVHVEKVKTFAPDVWHVVVDVKVRS